MAIVLGNLVVLYALIGLIFGVFFGFVGARRLDPDAADGTFLFRLILIPGAAVLWPYVMLKLVRGEVGAHGSRSQRRTENAA